MQTARELVAAIRDSGGLDAFHRAGQLRRVAESIAPEEPVPGPLIVAKPPPDDERALAIQWVPLINSVAAGSPREFCDLGYPAHTADRYVAVPSLNDPDAFAAFVHGDSMAPDYRDEDIVIFSPTRVLCDGCDVFARVTPDDEATFKRLFLEDDGASVRLQPINPAHRAKVYAREDVSGLVAAVRMIRRLDAVA